MIHYKEMPASDIAFQGTDGAVVAACKQPFAGHADGCPNFGKTWNCPPHAPGIEAIRKQVLSYSHVYLVYSERDVRGLEGGSPEALARFQLMTEEIEGFLDLLKTRYPDVLVFFGPSCRYCPDEGIGDCTCPDEPCRFPDRKNYPPEAVGVDVYGTMARAGVRMGSDITSVVRRVGIACFTAAVPMAAMAESYNG